MAALTAELRLGWGEAPGPAAAELPPRVGARWPLLVSPERTLTSQVPTVDAWAVPVLRQRAALAAAVTPELRQAAREERVAGAVGS